jgi:hypothetical protein
MAKIDEYLSKILSAIYGKDVRQAIHDSIAEINPIIVIGHEYLPIPFRKSGFVWHG